MTYVRDNGTVFAHGIRFQVSRTLFGTLVCLVEEGDRLLVLDTDGTVIIEHPWPAPGTKYVGSGRPRGPHTPA